MANANFARGFQPYDDKGVQTVNLKGTVDAANASSIGSGDAITAEIDGSIRRANATDSLSADNPTTTNQIIGVANQFRDPAGLNGPIALLLPATTAGEVQYIPAFGNRFVIQTDGTTVITAAAIGSLANLVVTGSADTTTGASQMELDSSTIGTGSQLVIEGLAEGSSFGEANARLIVSFNFYSGNAGTDQIT